MCTLSEAKLQIGICRIDKISIHGLCNAKENRCTCTFFYGVNYNDLHWMWLRIIARDSTRLQGHSDWGSKYCLRAFAMSVIWNQVHMLHKGWPVTCWFESALFVPPVCLHLPRLGWGSHLFWYVSRNEILGFRLHINTWATQVVVDMSPAVWWLCAMFCNSTFISRSC